MPVLDPGGVFKDYDLHKVATLSSGIEDMESKLLVKQIQLFNDRYCIVSMSCVINKNLIKMEMFDLR